MLKPLTRMENIKAGEDIKPLTRKEYFEKNSSGGGGGGVSGQYLKVYDSTEFLSEPIPVVSDIDGRTLTYTSGIYVKAKDYDANVINCALADISVLDSPFVYIEGTAVQLINGLLNNDDEVNPYTIPAGANMDAQFYVKEIAQNCKVARVSDVMYIIDSNYVTLGYGYTLKQIG